MYATHLRCADNWVEFAKLIFDAVLRRGGLWHLFGHSWEIEELKLWDGLTEILDYVANRPGVLYLANGPIVNLQLNKYSAAALCAVPGLDSQPQRHGVGNGRPAGWAL
jgi:hypothetical protein